MILVINKLRSALLIFLIGTGTVKCQELNGNRINTDSVNHTLQSVLEKYDIPGISLVIAKSDNILFINSVGVRNLATRESLKITDKMHIGSCTKAITGFVAGAIVKAGLIKWESTILEILPEFKYKINSAYYNATLNDLLSHHARIQPFDNIEEWIEIDRKKQFKGKDLIEKRYNFSQWVLGKEPVKMDSLKGREDYVYSNAGYVVAASLLERVTNESWNKLINKYVSKPLSIDIGVGWPASSGNNQPWGHWLNGDKTQLIPVSPNSSWYIPDLVDPAGDINMSTVDYGKWLQKNLRGLKGEDSEYTKEYYDYLHYANFKTSFYSIGWGSFDNSGYTFSNHSGSARTFYCHVVIVKELDLAIAAMCNAATDEAKNGIKKLIYGTLDPLLKE